MTTMLAKISEQEKALAGVTDIRDVRKIIAVAHGYTMAAWKHYKGLGGIAEVKEDRERAYETAARAEQSSDSEQRQDLGSLSNRNRKRGGWRQAKQGDLKSLPTMVGFLP